MEPENQSFLVQNTTTNDITKIVNGFNEFFFSVGPGLTKEIAKTEVGDFP